MNAVMTAEYVVLEYLSGQVLQEEINSHAAQGYRLLSFNTIPSTPEHDMTLTAVMVREIAAPTTVQAATLHKRITILEERLAKLERQQNFMLETSENRFEDIEAKIDWSK